MDGTPDHHLVSNNATAMPNATAIGPFQGYIGQPAAVSVPLYGYVAPVAILLSTVLNTLNAMILLRRNMRSSTNMLLLGMAVFDNLTGLFALPMILFIYSFRGYQEYLPFGGCYAYMYTYDFLPTIFHTASIWTTTALALQRYIYVCRVEMAKRWCTVVNSQRALGGIFVAAVVAVLPRLFENKIIPFEASSMIRANMTVVTCTITLNDWLTPARQSIYFNVVYWFRVFFIHMIPCILLVVLNAILIMKIRQAARNREHLVGRNRQSVEGRDNRSVTLMLTVVVSMFLVVEFPLGIHFTLVIIENTFSIPIHSNEMAALISLYTNFFIILSYPINFFIYCGMSKQFRDTFKDVICPRCALKPQETERDQSQTRYRRINLNQTTPYVTETTAV